MIELNFEIFYFDYNFYVFIFGDFDNVGIYFFCVF